MPCAAVVEAPPLTSNSRETPCGVSVGRSRDVKARMADHPPDLLRSISWGPGQGDGQAPHDPGDARCAGVLLRLPLDLATASIENANGLQRDYLPEGIDLGVHIPST